MKMLQDAVPDDHLARRRLAITSIAALTCDKCAGVRKGAPIVGMEVIWNLRPDGDRFVDGSVIDPESGRIFRCLVRMIDRGERMELTIYERFAIFGSKERWVRADAAR
jgi:uncharacterized protein (DUF2147 family)